MNKSIFAAAALAVLSGAALIPAPAMAQDAVPLESGSGRCPMNYYRGGFHSWMEDYDMKDRNMCYRKPKAVEDAEDARSSGPVYTPPTYGSIKKASAFDRCPVGYHTSEPDVMECVSYDYAAGKQPLTRAKNGKPCAADEVDEWGLWCTSKVTQLTRNEAEQEAVADVNHLFPRDGKGGNQGAEHYNTPGLVAIFGPKGGKQAAASTASEGSGDQPAAQQAAQCSTDSGSATGAVVGAAVGGEAGAALGGMLGGLGKKKKKKGC